MYLPILIPGLCVGTLLSLVFLAYSCCKTFHWSLKSRDARLVVVECVKTANGGQPGSQRRVITFGWQKLQVALRGGNRRVVVHASYGLTSSRELTAIIGPSGAGKSTLLDALAMRSCGVRTGDVLMNGDAVTDATIVAECTYISQEDHFLPSLTCFETLRVAAALKVKGSRSKREGVVEQSLGAVGLLKVAESQGMALQVGGLLPGGLRVRGISGGEKRRLSIACGIVGAPELIFLDEPTSGLDTSSALTVMQCIRALADEGRIVLSSIHQPRARIWELFDSVVVLAEGHTLYCGPTDGAVAWFTGCQGSSRQLQYIPELHGTVCEWLADIIAVPAEKKSEACGSGSLSSEDIVTMAKKLRESFTITAQPSAPAAEGLMHRSRRQSLWRQYVTLQFRATCSYSRNPANAAGRTVMAVGLAVLVGAVFFRQPPGDEGVRQDVAGLFFVALLLTLMPYTYMSMFVADRVFFQEDPLQPLYSTPAYYASVSGINALVSTLNGILLMLIVYGFLGLLPTVRAVLLSLVVTALHSLCSVQLLVMMANLCPNQDLAFVLAVSYTTLSVLLSGYFVRLANVATFFRGLSYLTYFRYTVMAFVRLQYGHREDDDCRMRSGGLTCEAILQQFDVDLSLQTCILGLVVILTVMHFAGLGGLMRSKMR